MDYEIFISYRRTDSDGNISGRDIARLLSKEFKLYGYKTFFDYSELNDCDFAETIIPAVRKCKIFILVLTKDALQRCSNSDDWVRREITEAINNGCKIIPVDPDNSFNGWPDNFPLELDSIKTIQMFSIDMNSNFEVLVKHLIDTRIANVIPTRISANRRIYTSKYGVDFSIGDKDFSMPDEFFNNEVYNALIRSYGKEGICNR